MTTTGGWLKHLRDNPLPWLLSTDNPDVRHLALRWLLDAPADDRDVVAAQRAAMSAEPIASILAAMHMQGYWEKPGAASWALPPMRAYGRRSSG
jgi:hypothetical protein